MHNDCKTDPSDILVGIGPSIGPLSFMVGRDLIDMIHEVFGPQADQYVHSREGSYYLNLWKIIEKQLIKMGVAKKNIESANIDTFTDTRFFFTSPYAGESRTFCVWNFFDVKNLLFLKKSIHLPLIFSLGAIAQLVEQRTENPCVPGSIPGGTTIPSLWSGFFIFFLLLTYG